MCFNPRPHTRGDTIRRFDASGLDVSIHAPTRGATYIDKTHVVKYLVSIHAPTRGATAHAALVTHTFSSFNPRPHAGGDSSSSITDVASVSFQSTPPRGGRHKVRLSATTHSVVSIHAPARGATDWFCNAIASSRFQSTLPREGRQAGKPHLTGSLSFNPRPHARGDQTFKPPRL